MSDPFADPFGGPSKSSNPFSRLEHLIQGIGDRVSPHHVEHFQARAQQVGGQAADRAVGFAANNPETMERAGEKAGERIGQAAIPIPFVGKRVGRMVGRQVGRGLAESAQRRAGGAQQFGSQQSSDPFAGSPSGRSSVADTSRGSHPLDPFADSYQPPASSAPASSSSSGYGDPFANQTPAQEETPKASKGRGLLGGRKKKAQESEPEPDLSDPFR